MSSSKPGSFTAYLEYAGKDRAERSTSGAPASPLTLLRLLADQPEQQLPLFELARRSTLAPADFSGAVKKLMQSGFVTVEGPPLEEVAKLTSKGLDVVKLA